MTIRTHPKLTGREGWLIAKHIPLDGDALHMAGHAIACELFNNSERYRDEVTGLVAAITSESRHARAFMAEIVFDITGVTIEADAVKEIEFSKLLRFLQLVFEGYKPELQLPSGRSYHDMFYELTYPLFLEAETETRELIRLGFEMDLYWPGITCECECDLLSCIPSSSLIVEYDLVQILVQLDDLSDVPLAIVCKSWHAVCAESWLPGL
jgi:hypothetical protein